MLCKTPFFFLRSISARYWDRRFAIRLGLEGQSLAQSHGLLFCSEWACFLGAGESD